MLTHTSIRLWRFLIASRDETDHEEILYDGSRAVHDKRVALIRNQDEILYVGED